MNNSEKLMDFLSKLSAWNDLGDKIEYCNRELRKLQYSIYLINYNKNLSLEEKKIQIDEINELYDGINIIYNEYSDEYFENFKKEILSNLERFPNDICITYLNGLLKKYNDNDNDEDKSVEIFLNNELRKQKIKKILND